MFRVKNIFFLAWIANTSVTPPLSYLPAICYVLHPTYLHAIGYRRRDDDHDEDDDVLNSTVVVMVVTAYRGDIKCTEQDTINMEVYNNNINLQWYCPTCSHQFTPFSNYAIHDGGYNLWLPIIYHCTRLDSERDGLAALLGTEIW